MKRTVDSAPYSTLDEAGIRKVERTRLMKLDLRTLPARKASFGMGGDTAQVSGPEYVLVLDGPAGRTTTTTRLIAIDAIGTGPDLGGVFVKRSFGSLADGIGELNAAVGRWGLRREDADRAIAELRTHAEPGCPQVPFKTTDDDCDLKTEPGSGVNRAGLVTGVGLRYDATAERVTVNYDVYLWPRLYTPEALERIRTTGRLPV